MAELSLRYIVESILILPAILRGENRTMGDSALSEIRLSNRHPATCLKMAGNIENVLKGSQVVKNAGADGARFRIFGYNTPDNYMRREESDPLDPGKDVWEPGRTYQKATKTVKVNEFNFDRWI